MSAWPAIWAGAYSNIAKDKTDVFTKQYGLKRFVFAERHELIIQVIQREKLIKHWPRAWKVELIRTLNLEWNDLYDSLI